MNDALYWLLLTLTCIFFQALFCMLEMAAVSFNKVRLQYYVIKRNQAAVWLDYLLKSPTRLFGTTLLGVNISLQVGSECSRQFYTAMQLNPDIAPITQVFLVLIFAELAPMFAARKYAENVVMLGIFIVYFSSKLLKPIIWAIHHLSNFVNYLAGLANEENSLFLSRDELQNAIKQCDDIPSSKEHDEFNAIVNNIFTLRSKKANEVMLPLNAVQALPSSCTVAHVQNVLKNCYHPYIPIFHRYRHNIIGIAFPRDLIPVPNNHYVREYIRPPWFVTKQASSNQILRQFRSNNQNIAIVLNKNGHAIGILTLEDVLEEVFGEMDEALEKEGFQKNSQTRSVLERTFSGKVKISELNKEFSTQLPLEGNESLEQYLQNYTGHDLEKGEIIRSEGLEFTVLESSLLASQTKISVKTLI